MEQKKTVSYTEVLQNDFYCHCGTWIYTPQMNGTKVNGENNETPCIGEGCTREDNDGEFMECPECKAKFYLV